jgi:hypothetical protein
MVNDPNKQSKEIGRIKLQKGILQGDSLSPLLFTVCMEPISRLITKHKLVVALNTNNGLVTNLNHLLFVDDIKIFTKSEDDLAYILNDLKIALSKIG